MIRTGKYQLQVQEKFNSCLCDIIKQNKEEREGSDTDLAGVPEDNRATHLQCFIQYQFLTVGLVRQTGLWSGSHRDIVHRKGTLEAGLEAHFTALSDCKNYISRFSKKTPEHGNSYSRWVLSHMQIFSKYFSRCLCTTCSAGRHSCSESP